MHPDSPFFVHDTALCDSNTVGPGTTIWAFSHIMKDAVIGANCNVGDHCFIENDVVIGDDCVIKNNISIWDGIKLGNRVFLGPNVVLTNDLRPRAKVRRESFSKTIIEDGASIGANATIVCGITIGKYAMIGAGSVVTRDVPAYKLVYGNPASLHGTICKCGESINFKQMSVTCICGLRYAEKDGLVVPQ